MSETNNAAKNWLADHPRMIGVLFTMLLLLTQAGSAAAAEGGACFGP